MPSSGRAAEGPLDRQTGPAHSEVPEAGGKGQ